MTSLLKYVIQLNTDAIHFNMLYTNLKRSAINRFSYITDLKLSPYTSDIDLWQLALRLSQWSVSWPLAASRSCGDPEVNQRYTLALASTYYYEISAPGTHTHIPRHIWYNPLLIQAGNNPATTQLSHPFNLTKLHCYLPNYTSVHFDISTLVYVLFMCVLAY